MNPDERRVAAKQSLEARYTRVNKLKEDRELRKQNLQQKMEEMQLDADKQTQAVELHNRTETQHLRAQRLKLTVADFDQLDIIGRGAFGEVRLCKEKTSGNIFAMKKLKKAEMVLKGQVQHVHAELEVMSEADETNEWVVKLHYSFQDDEFLYLVMEYVPGGDMMSLLMKRDVLTEEETRFYVAQTILAIDSLHTRGYIHRDLKPDNLLLDLEGHIKLSDFGLVKSLAQTKLKFYTPGGAGTLANTSGGDGGADGAAASSDGTALEQMSAEQGARKEGWESMSRRERMATWNRNRKAVIWSTVGTPDYMAPEILFEIGYNKDCDFWSLGVVVYEMLVGYPPFYGDDPLVTCRKILCFKETLQFPPEASLSAQAEHLIRSLLCDREERLGRNGADEIKQHPFFAGIDWSSLRSPGAAPFKPQVESATDTSHFDKFEEKDEAAPPGTTPPGSARGDDLAFLGYQYKRYPSCSDILLNAIGESGDSAEPSARWSAGSSAVSPLAAGTVAGAAAASTGAGGSVGASDTEAADEDRGGGAAGAAEAPSPPP